MFGYRDKGRPGRFFGQPIVVIALVCSMIAPLAAAGSLVVGAGSSVDTGAGHVDLGCGDASVNGQVAGRLIGARHLSFGPGAVASGAQLGLSGDWINSATPMLDARVTWRDGCGVNQSRMLGSTDLVALDIESTSGREIRFDASGEQTVRDDLRLVGAPDQFLRLRSTAPGQLASLSLDAFAQQSIDWVDVAGIDSRAGQGIAPGLAIEYNSQASGSALNWFGLPPIPVSTLGRTSILLLIMLIGLLGLFRHRFKGLPVH